MPQLPVLKFGAAHAKHDVARDLLSQRTCGLHVSDIQYSTATSHATSIVNDSTLPMSAAVGKKVREVYWGGIEGAHSWLTESSTTDATEAACTGLYVLHDA